MLQDTVRVLPGWQALGLRPKCGFPMGSLASALGLAAKWFLAPLISQIYPTRTYFSLCMYFQRRCPSQGSVGWQQRPEQLLQGWREAYLEGISTAVNAKSQNPQNKARA